MKQQLLTLLIALMASSGLMSAANGIGKFSISATQQVIFSPGNLQYNAALGTHQCADGTTKQGTWRFAPNQWDIVGENNKNISSTYNGWIDLFGWGTSGWESGANAYQPWSQNTYYGDYYPGGSKYNHITGNYAKADWGVYNQIGNDAPGTWRTLTGNEWMYLLHGRTKAASLFGLGIVNGVRGIIILPDDWVTPSGVTFYAGSGSWLDNCYYNKNGNDFSHNVFVSGPSGTWDAMAASGAVFLPASGNRSGYTSLSYTGTGGYYWSSTVQSTQNYTYASDMYFRDEFLVPSGLGNRGLGCAVRLVRLPSELDDNPETYTITFVDADGNTIGSPQVVEPGQSATPPTPPTRADYNFAGWIGNYQNVTADATIYASYEHTNRLLLGVFSISDTETVLFSQGNLQYHATAGTHKCADGSTKQGVWRFAEHQYDMIAEGNTNISASYAGWIDLFGWGTSGWESGANAYQPYSTSEVNSDYYPGGSAENSLTGAYQYADWGVYNAIFNGSNQHSLWRTLTGEQLGYIYSGRANAAMKRSTATINGITGYIFLPDMWVQPTGISFTADANDYSSNVYTLSQWKLMEESGAVFLPSAGFRRNGTIATSSLIMGDYWASTAYDTDCANRLMTREDKVLAGIDSKEERHYGFSVRLIKDVICHTITFEANGGVIPTTGNMGKQFAVHKTSLSADQTYGTVTVRSGYSFFATMTNDCPTREGYVFEGWFDSAGEQVYDNTGSDIEGSYWSAAHHWKGSSDVTLYAHWTPLSYTITTDATNGTVTGGGTYDYGTNLQLTANPADCYQFTQWSDGNTHNPRTITVTGDATYTAEFSKIQYAVQFNNYDGTPLQNTNVDCGTLPSYNGENPTKPADAQYTYTFAGWTPELVAVTGDATYTATFTATPIPSPDSIYVHDGEDPNLCDLAAHSLSHVIIEPGGELNVDLSCVHVDVITIISTGIQSGQIHHGSNPIPTNHIFLEYILNPLGTSASPNLWYAFAVPFEVDIETGITRAYGSTSHISGTDFLIKEYDGNLRATTGKGWKSKLTGTLEPGHFYMIGIEGTCNRWLFEKKSEAAVEGDKHMQVKTYIANTAEYNNWNGLGNTRLEYSTMDLSGLGIEYILTYNSQFNKYDISLASAVSLCVGKPFFVQAISAGEFDFVHNSGSNNMPALYAQRDTKPLMHFTLTDETQSTGIDHMYLTLHEDAQSSYTIGRDIARMTTDCKTATQLWSTMSDGTELSAHGIEFPDTETIVPLTLFAPKDGEYLVNMSSRAMSDYDVELLHNGALVATLDAQPVTLNLNAGTNSGYSLRISRKAPTGLGDVQSDKAQSTKVVENGVLYIIRDGVRYNAQGQMIK